MIHLRRVQRTGRSLSVVVPRPLADQLGLHRGDLVALVIEDGRLVAKAIDQVDLLQRGRPAHSLAPAPRRRRR